jgi:hypothetical protein
MPLPKTGCGRLLGESRPLANPVGTGRGGDVTGDAILVSLLAGRNHWRRQPRLAE